MTNDLKVPLYILDRFESEGGNKILNIDRIEAGMNNRLYKLLCKNGNYLLKIYSNDNEDRLRREYPALSYLSAVGFEEVPEGIIVDYKNGWAIYAFMEGNKKTAQDLSRNDLIAIAKYVNK